MLIDVAVLGDRNVIKKEAENILKYPCNRNTAHVECKTKVTLVIRSNRGNRNHSKSFRKYLSSVPERHEVKELWETAILGTAHAFWKVLI
jgi:hypothetical protein